ncbi:MAG: RNA polymerase sigma factor (sigma-70 family) [Bradymonadia bacterium]|jgi:RNA polymerase sigma factor (sigma-70 family)
MSDSKLMHTDSHWLAGYRRGDADALKRVFETHSDELQKLLLTGMVTKSEGKRVRIRIQDPDERDEITNEVFARAFSVATRRNYRGIAPFFPYLCRICRNVVVDRFHAARREQALFRSDNVDSPSGGFALSEQAADWQTGPVSLGRSPELSAARSQLSTALQSFMTTLTDEERELLRLYYEDDASQRDAAERLGIDRNRVRYLVAGVRRRLLTHMRNERLIDKLDPNQLLEIIAALIVAGMAL